MWDNLYRFQTTHVWRDDLVSAQREGICNIFALSCPLILSFFPAVHEHTKKPHQKNHNEKFAHWRCNFNYSPTMLFSLATVIKAYDFITWDMQIILAASDHDKWASIIIKYDACLDDIVRFSREQISYFLTLNHAQKGAV